MLARSDSSIGVLIFEEAPSPMISSHGKTLTGTEVQLSFGSLMIKVCILKDIRSVACNSLSNLEEEIIIFGSNSPNRGFNPVGFMSMLRGVTTAPVFRMA